MLFKIEALQYQLSSHFTFNAVNSIQSYMLLGKQEDALDYLSYFSNYLRSNIDNINIDRISIFQEIEYLHYYLKIEQMRFPDLFKFKLDISTNINTAKSTLPPMLIQPFIDKAIHFGFTNTISSNLLYINFELEGKSILKCEIIDNGIGREKHKKTRSSVNTKENYKSTVKQRITLLNKINNDSLEYKIETQDLYYNNKSIGTKVCIYIPLYN